MIVKSFGGTAYDLYQTAMLDAEADIYLGYEGMRAVRSANTGETADTLRAISAALWQHARSTIRRRMKDVESCTVLSFAQTRELTELGNRILAETSDL